MSEEEGEDGYVLNLDVEDDERGDDFDEDIEIKPLPSNADEAFFRAYISKLEVSHMHLRQQNQFLKTTIESYKQEYEDAVEKLNDLQIKLSDKDEEFNLYKIINNTISDIQLEEIRGELLQKVTEEKQQVEEKLLTANKNIDDLRYRTTEEINSLKEKVKATEQELDIKLQEIESYKIINENRENNDRIEIEKLNINLEEIKQKLDEKTEQFTLLTDEYEDLKKKYFITEQQYNNNQTELEKCLNSIDELQNAIQEREDEINELKQECEDKNSKINEFEQYNNHIGNNDNEETIELYKGEIERLKNEINTKNGEYQYQLDFARKEKERMMDEMKKDSENEIESLKMEIEAKYHEQIESLELQLKNAIDKYKLKKNQLKEKLKEHYTKEMMGKIENFMEEYKRATELE